MLCDLAGKFGLFCDVVTGIFDHMIPQNTPTTLIQGMGWGSR